MAIKAVDRDEGRNGYVEYMLEENDLPFTLGLVDGLLRVSGPLDREQKSNYTLAVIARDRGEPSRSSSTNVTVMVLDENDNSPVFDPRQYSATVAENASIGASVLQVSKIAISKKIERYDFSSKCLKFFNKINLESRANFHAKFNKDLYNFYETCIRNILILDTILINNNIN